MLEWRAQGLVLASRRHGENNAILDVFTEEKGRQAGIVRGGGGRRLGPLLQPGAELHLTWRARLEEHMGAFTVEPARSRAGLLADRLALAGLNAVCSLLLFALPEREPHPQLCRASRDLLDRMASDPGWPAAYLEWELALLEETGFGLDLSACAVTGRTEGLAFVSPRTGRAVSAEGAGDWADRLLPLPPCLAGAPPETLQDVVAALRVTGHFLHHHLAPAIGDRPPPEARERLLGALARLAAGSG